MREQALSVLSSRLISSQVWLGHARLGVPRVGAVARAGTSSRINVFPLFGDLLFRILHEKGADQPES